MFAHRCRKKVETTVHNSLTIYVMCDAKIDKTGPFHAFLSHILEKHPFSCLGPILPPFSRIRAYTRSSRKNTPLYAFSCSRMGTKVELELPPRDSSGLPDSDASVPWLGAIVHTEWHLECALPNCFRVLIAAVWCSRRRVCSLFCESLVLCFVRVHASLP